LIVPGSLITSNFVSVNNSTFPASTSLVKITASNNFITIPPSNQDYLLQLTGKDNTAARLIVDSFGTGTYSVVAGRSARGNAAFPTVTQTGDVLSRFGGSGYGTSGFLGSGTGRLDLVAAENFTDTAKGTNIQLWTTPAGSNTPSISATFSNTSVSFTGYVNPQRGFIYNPNTIPGIVNTFTVDIANNSVYKLMCNATTTLSISGYLQGKVTEVWITNTDNNNHNITHGCLANNSTVGASSFSLTAQHSAYLRYMCFNNDSANVFVSIAYS
jgi:hypothetical protein